MKKFLIAAFVILPSIVFAGATWSGDKAARTSTSSTGTETKPTSATAGIDLTGLAAVDVFVAPIGTATAGGKIVYYLRNPVTGEWAAYPFDDYVSTAVTTQVFTVEVEGYVSGERLSPEPNGLGTTVTITAVGTPRR